MLIARALWIFPIILLGLGLHQLDAFRDIRHTFLHGVPATAAVTEFASSDRVDVTYDYVSLRVVVDGRVIERTRMSLPHSFAPLMEGKEVVDVMVSAGGDQEIVITELGRAHYRIAAINAAMALSGALLLAIGVGWWNRYLRRRGDPAARLADQSRLPEQQREQQGDASLLPGAEPA